MGSMISFGRQPARIKPVLVNVRPSVIQTTTRTFNQSLDDTSCRRMHTSTTINQSIKLSMKQSVSQSAKHTIKPTTKQCGTSKQLVDQSVNPPTNQSTQQSVSQSIKPIKRLNHMDLTASAPRESHLLDATIVSVKPLSPTVHSVMLRINEPVGQSDNQSLSHSTDPPSNQSISFKAGQWVDFFIPDQPIVGGFSIASSPHLFKTDRSIELAIKRTNHPPAKWIHDQPINQKIPGTISTNEYSIHQSINSSPHYVPATINQSVKIRFGGSCFYDPASDRARDVLLIAGGVGISPLMSIARQRYHESIDQSGPLSTNSNDGFLAQKIIQPIGSTILLHSVRDEQELLFKSSIQSMENDDRFNFDYLPAVTSSRSISQPVNQSFNQSNHHSTHLSISQPINPTTSHSTMQSINQSGLRRHRIDESLVKSCLKTDSLIFLCGPPTMIDDWKLRLTQLGVRNENIRTERWW